VHGEIVDGVATTTIDQVIRNEGGVDVEGTWFLPLPAGAVADAFTMTVGGKEIAGEVLDAGKARSVYESIVRKRRDPGLLEYAGDGMLRARIFPIPARGEVGVTVRLRQVLQPVGGVYEWAWPLRALRMGDAGIGSVALDVRIKSRTPLSTVMAPHATAEIRRIGEYEAVVTLETASSGIEDLKVLYGLAEQEFGLHMLPFRLANEPGYFAMLLSPPRAIAEGKTPRRCVQFVVDTSGSMAGQKIAQAKAAVRAFLNSLRADDVFQVITFASSVQPFFDQPMRATAANVEEAARRIDALSALGGTNISEALQKALEALAPAPDDGGGWLQQVVFVTDGQATMGLTNPQQILELTKRVDTKQTRIFALGVGDDIDVHLIDDLVDLHRGARDFVRSEEKIEVKVDALCRKIAQPALTDVEVRCEGLEAFDVHPTRTRDLFCGEVMQVVGRYRDSGKHQVTVRGRQNGVEKQFVFEVDFPAASDQYTFVQTLWARQHVASLLDGIRRNGQKAELIGEVRRLATQYGIVTPYTSQLILEESMRLAGDRPLYTRPDGGRVAGGPGGAYQGPADAAPRGPTTGGPAGPGASGASGAPEAKRLDDLGRSRTGAEAVEQSLETGNDDLYLGASRREVVKKARDREARVIRRAAGRTFLMVGEDLVEQGLPADWAVQAVVIDAFGDAYFELAKQRPQLREILALGDRVVFRDGERIVQVRPAPPK
jgi:Ca-activated chloride channel family protein